MPVGPAILWADATTKSAPSVRTSTGMAGTDWHASSSSTAPALRTASPSSAVLGSTLPSTLLMWTRATAFTRPACSASRACRAPKSMAVLSGVKGTPTTRAPVRAATSCQGTRLAWCSATDTRMTSPALRLAPPQEAATRLMASVAPRVSTMSAGAAAPMKAATLARPPS